MDSSSSTGADDLPDLEREYERARALDTDALADAIESIGFSCTRCGACCTAHGEGEEHTATVFPGEIRGMQDATDGEWRDIARPIPYGLTEGPDGLEGETLEWALQTDGCGDCAFYEEDERGTGACTAHADRPLICRTYPFSLALGGTSQPMGEPVESEALRASSSRPQADDSEALRASSSRPQAGDRAGLRPAGSPAKPGDITEQGSVSSQNAKRSGDNDGLLRAHECEGLGREISRDDAKALAIALKRRAIREIEETMAVSETYEPADPDRGEIVVHDSEGAKHPDGTPL